MKKSLLVGALLFGSGMMVADLDLYTSADEVALAHPEKKSCPVTKKKYKACKKKCEESRQADALKGLYPDEDDYADAVELCAQEECDQGYYSDCSLEEMMSEDSGVILPGVQDEE